MASSTLARRRRCCRRGGGRTVTPQRNDGRPSRPVGQPRTCCLLRACPAAARSRIFWWTPPPSASRPTSSRSPGTCHSAMSLRRRRMHCAASTGPHSLIQLDGRFGPELPPVGRRGRQLSRLLSVRRAASDIIDGPDHPGLHKLGRPGATEERLDDAGKFHGCGLELHAVARHDFERAEPNG